MLSEIFWIAFLSTSSAVVLKLASLCFKSKCKEVKLCGGRMSCIRDTESEIKMDELELSQRTLGNKYPSQNQLNIE
jgi:hypothetical protein